MPFEILNTEHVYQGKVFSVERALLRLPDGVERYYDLVRHGGAVTLIPVDDQGRIYFVRQYRIGANDTLLELPAGTVEADEDFHFAAAREVREEIGKAASELIKIGECFLAPGYSTEFMHFFLATGLYDAPLEADADEFLEVEAIPYRQVFQMVEEGLIIDGKTLAALMLARPHLNRIFGAK